MRRLASNAELYAFLLSLAARLGSRGAAATAEVVNVASRHAAGSSTEFLGESRMALRLVAAVENPVLSLAERSEVDAVLRQLDAALARKSW